MSPHILASVRHQRGRSLKTKQKAVADRSLKELEYRLSRQELGRAVDATFDHLRDAYLTYCKATKKASTYERHDLPRVTASVADLLLRRLMFATLPEAKVLVERWPRHCNEVMLHRSLGYRPPAPTAIRPMPPRY